MSQSTDPGRTGNDPDPTRRSSENADAYQQVYDSPEFSELRRRFRRLVVPLVAGFLGWYFLYVLLATYAHEVMSHEVAGRINVGLLLGLGQFVTTFGIAWLYALRADRDIDPLSRELNERFTHLSSESGGRGGG